MGLLMMSITFLLGVVGGIIATLLYQKERQKEEKLFIDYVNDQVKDIIGWTDKEEIIECDSEGHLFP